ncbi:MAG: formylglycine-generating enzyme family protein [Bacteroidetes bacterium]|nr:formylglycine-generating enzyme family protein [Bacteroidota bacterium]
MNYAKASIGLALALLIQFPSIGQAFKNYVEFGPKLLVNQYEVSNADYKLFLNDIAEDISEDQLEAFKVDSSYWQNFNAGDYNDPMMDKYHRHPAFNNFPVVNISKAAAVAYCKWLTEKYHQQSKRDFKKVVFRLPTEDEWISFAKPLLNNRLPWYGSLPYTPEKNGKISPILCNIKFQNLSEGSVNYIADAGFYARKVGSYPPNSLGLYDIIGNVAELTADGISKGGSWDSFIEECYIDLQGEFQMPDPRLGFRVVMEVIEP